jgi:hypothetical protein
LGEAHTERYEPAADVRIGALEGDAPPLVGIEPEMQESADEATTLRCPHYDRLIVRAVDGISSLALVLLLVLEEGGKVARGREPEA